MSEKLQQEGQPVALSDVIKAIQVVDAEAARRGEMYPQLADEHCADRAAARRVIESLNFYSGQGCERWKEWPRMATTPSDSNETIQLTPPGAQVTQHRFIDESDAVEQGVEWLREHAAGRQIAYMEESYHAQAPRMKWMIVFDSNDKLTHAALLTRDLLNWTQLTLVGINAQSNENTGEQGDNEHAVSANSLMWQLAARCKMPDHHILRMNGGQLSFETQSGLVQFAKTIIAQNAALHLDDLLERQVGDVEAPATLEQYGTPTALALEQQRRAHISAMNSAMPLSARVRAGSEAAPWVVDEIKKLEATLATYQKENQ